MKAPEKIYIPRLEGNETFVHEWSATKFRKYFSREIAENIEYTRTDAFIEKAYEWIENNMLSSNQHDKSRLFYKQFVDYIKGE